jgi:hypothetical protein
MVNKENMFTLQLETGTISFILKASDDISGFYDFDIECLMDEKYTGFYPKNNFCSLHMKDLYQLIEYFDSHYKKLLFYNGNIESPVFTPMKGHFQLQCMEGDIDKTDHNDGYFSLTMLFNCGSSDKFLMDAYFGFDTIVTIKNSHRFINEIKKRMNLKSIPISSLKIE